MEKLKKIIEEKTIEMLAVGLLNSKGSRLKCEIEIAIRCLDVLQGKKIETEVTEFFKKKHSNYDFYKTEIKFEEREEDSFLSKEIDQIEKYKTVLDDFKEIIDEVNRVDELQKTNEKKILDNYFNYKVIDETILYLKEMGCFEITHKSKRMMDTLSYTEHTITFRETLDISLGKSCDSCVNYLLHESEGPCKTCFGYSKFQKR